MLNITTETQQKLVEHQCELEQLYSKNQLVPRMRKEFQEAIDEVPLTEIMIRNKIPLPFGLDLLVQMDLHKKAQVGTLVGLLYHHFEDGQTCADMLHRAMMADLIDWERSIGDEGMFTVIYEISDEVQAELDRFQYPLPMVVPPLEITNNRETGYYLGSGSVILKKNHTEDDVCLDHLNRANAVRFTINADTAQMIKNKWKNLDHQKPDETRDEFEQRKKAFRKYDRCSKDVMAILLKHSEHFYLTHAYDKRGRVYCKGYHVSYQATPWNKAVIEFADKEYVE